MILDPQNVKLIFTTGMFHGKRTKHALSTKSTAGSFNWLKACEFYVNGVLNHVGVVLPCRPMESKCLSETRKICEDFSYIQIGYDLLHENLLQFRK